MGAAVRGGIPASEAVADGRVVEEEYAARLDTLGERVVQYANIEPDPRTFEGEENAGAD